MSNQHYELKQPLTTIAYSITGTANIESLETGEIVIPTGQEKDGYIHAMSAAGLIRIPVSLLKNYKS